MTASLNDAVRVDGVAMVEGASRCLGASMAGAAAHGHLGVRRGGRLVRRDDAQRFVAGEDHLQGTDDDALKRVATAAADADVRRHLFDERGQHIEVEVVASQRSERVRAAGPSVPLERRGMRHMFFGEMVGKVRDRDVETCGRGDTSFEDRIFVVVAQGDQVALERQVGELESCNPLRRGDRGIPRPLRRSASASRSATAGAL